MNIYIELIGYVGSLLVVVAMLMTSVKKLRIINTIGSAIFMVYALIIKSYPTAAMNLFLIVINVINIVKLIRMPRNFKVAECYKDESLVQFFLESHSDDIHKFFPEFDSTGNHLLSYLVISGSEPVGIIIGKMNGIDSFDIELDYTIPAFRDFSVGTFLYEYLGEALDVEKITFNQITEGHDKYLTKMGFVKEENEYIKWFKKSV